MTSEPRAYTKEELCDQFLDRIRSIAQYWDKLPDKNSTEKINGVVHSILCVLDGASTMPAFDVTVRPHPLDKQDCIDHGENWYEPGTPVEGDKLLHDLWFKHELK